MKQTWLGFGLGLSFLALGACGSEDDSMGKTNSDSSPVNTCTAEDPPEDAVRLGVAFPGLNKGYNLPRQRLAIDGNVFVERADPEHLDLVDEAGQRVALTSGSSAVSFEGIAVGTRFWLSAWEHFEKPNPFAAVTSHAFSLRTEEDGPVLLAGLSGTTDGAAASLGLPISIQSTCTSETALQSSDPECVRRVERFEAILDADTAVHVAPGTHVTTELDGTSYEIGLSYAEYTTYPNFAFDCGPADFAAQVRLELNVVSRRWAELAADQPVELAELPECRLGTDAPFVVIDTERLDQEQIANGNAEFAISPASSADGVLEFSSDYGSVSVAGEPEVLAVLEQARWFSLSGFYAMIFRETADGDALLARSWGTVEDIQVFARRTDVLGVDMEFAPRCDWLSDVCLADGAAAGDPAAIVLYDIVYGEASEPVPSHERATVDVGTRQFDTWVAVTPSCNAEPTAAAIFVARDE